MRFIPLFLGGLMLAIPACAERTGAEPRREDFTLKPEVIEALEGGPVVFRLTLTYQREKPVEMFFFTYPEWHRCTFSTPKGWERFDEPCDRSNGTINGILGVERTIKQGDQVSRTVYIHEEFKRIPSGRASVKLSWQVIHVLGEPGREITAPFEFDVPPATPERLAQVRKRMEAVLDRPGRTEDDPRGVARWILGTRHAAFVPVALRLIATRDLPYVDRDLLDFAYCISEDPDEIHVRLVTLACDPAWDKRLGLFEYWRSRCEDDPTAPNEIRADMEALARDPKKASRVEMYYPYWPSRRISLPAGEFAKLLNAKHIWTRILTYVTFPSRCPPAWARALVEDCRQLTQPISRSQLAPLLRDLDDDSFRVRESASAKIEQLGEPVEFQLQEALQGNLSPEVKRRVRQILERIATAKQAPEWKPILEHLDTRAANKAASLAVLRALAQGRPDAELTKAAIANPRRLSSPE